MTWAACSGEGPSARQGAPQGRGGSRGFPTGRAANNEAPRTAGASPLMRHRAFPPAHSLLQRHPADATTCSPRPRRCALSSRRGRHLEGQTCTALCGAQTVGRVFKTSSWARSRRCTFEPGATFTSSPSSTASSKRDATLRTSEVVAIPAVCSRRCASHPDLRTA